MKPNQAIQHFLRTGDYDPLHASWPGDAFQRCRQAERDLRLALVRKVQRRSRAFSQPDFADLDYRGFTRRKVEPMVRGLFSSGEQEPALSTLENSVVFLTRKSIEPVIMDSTWLHTAWTLSNLYLGSLGAELLGPDAPKIVGLSEETTCYISTAYFHEPFFPVALLAIAPPREKGAGGSHDVSDLYRQKGTKGCPRPVQNPEVQ